VTNSQTTLDANLDVMINGVTDREKQILQDVMRLYFGKLEESERHWDGIEVGKYRQDRQAFAQFLLSGK
jgi:hypothetical protein